MSTTPLSYKDAGVDIDAGDALVERIKPLAKKTMREGVLAGIGGFGALFEVPKRYKEPVLVSGTDGVGTKLKLAFEWNMHDTVGIDLVAMSVNDVLVQGAEPLFFLDYFACGKLDVDTAAAVVGGIARGCELSGCALIGGETAEMPGMYPAGEYDLAGFCVGAVEKSKILTGQNVAAGDVVLGLASHGVHSNGFSLVRKIVSDSKLDYTKNVAEFGTRSLGEVLLEPTKLYTGVLNSLLESELGSAVHAMSHITGGGISANLSRVLPQTVSLDVERNSWSPNQVFKVLAGWGGFDLKDLESTWNLGLGFAVVVRKDFAAEIQGMISELGIPAWQLGIIESTACDAELPGYVSEAKGVRGGAVRLVGNYAE